MKMIKIQPNSNFYSLYGSSLPTVISEEYKEYRRCWTENPKNFIVREFPLHIDIESTSICNLRCTFCDKLPLLKPGQLGMIEFDLFKKIIDEGRNYNLWGVKLSYRGEPLLHPKISDMVSYAKKNNILDVYFNTNGMLLTEEMNIKLIDANLDRISISIETNDPEKFEKIRIGADFKKILRNIEKLNEIKIKMGVSHPKIRIQTILSDKITEFDIESYKNFWKPFCDEVAAIDYKDESNRKTGIVYDWACPQLWQRLTIEWDGTVLGCNNDDMRKLIIGNAYSKSIYLCWHDELLKQTREKHKQGKSHEIEACNGCPWRTAQINKLTSLK